MIGQIWIWKRSCRNCIWNSISFGSPIVFESNGSASYISAVYDSSNNQVVIAYRDGENNDYGTAVVFAESGLSIPQIGSAAVFESATTSFFQEHMTQ